jgi:ribonucleoside-diphosphate reductase alpha chain
VTSAPDTDVDLPIKRTDGDTIEERLTDNAYNNILPARYLRKDADGTPVETQEELFPRVAKNVALAEAVYEAQRLGVEVTVTPDQLKPDHPRRDELAEEVFGKGTTAEDNAETTLTEHNVNKFAYDTVVPELDDDVASRVREVRTEFETLMSELSFMPNSPTLMNAGDELQQLSACFVDSPEDDITDIHQTAKEAAEVFQSGGGMGYAFWRLRPYGDAVGSTGGIASGPITFMRTFDQMCFPPGTKVLTPDGQRPVESLREGDLVIDENGDAQPVVETMERNVDENIVEVTPDRVNKPIRATNEHPFKVAREDGFEWVDAADLSEGDLLVLGHAVDENALTLDETLDLSEVASGPLVFADGGVTINREYYDASKGPAPASIASDVPVDAFATVAGWYLAEGCVVYRRGLPNEVTFTLHADERAASEEIVDALDAFDVSCRVETDESRNTQHVHVESASFAQLIEGLFGTGASEKQVPDFLWNAPVETQTRVVEALFAGDGTTETRGDSQRVKLQMTCEEVVDFVFQAGLRAGVQFSRHRRTPDDRKQTYWVSASVSTALGTPLSGLFDDVPDDFAARDRTKQRNGREVVKVGSVDTVAYEGPVYNAEVAGTHTYVAEDLVVHNCETIAQGGARRGAQMGVMRVSHPDVIQFIHAKNKDVSLANTLRLNDPDDFTHNSFADALEEARDLIDDEGRVPEHLRNAVEGHLSNFNISVGVTDDFMEALKNGEEFTFTNPRTGEAHVATHETKELYDMFGLGEHVEVGEELSVPAEILWEQLIEGAHENGEPGVIYLERVNKKHSFDVEEHPDHRILATNPCVTGDTLISTENGLVPAEELYEQGTAQDVVVDGRLSEEPLKEASSVYATGEKDVYELTTGEGYSLRLTADHRVMTDDGWVEAGELDAGDTVHIQNRKGSFGRHGSAAEGRTLGWLVGDGHLKHGEERAVLNFYDEDSEVSEAFADDVNEVIREPTGNANYEVGVSEISRSDEYRGAGAVEQRIRSNRLYEYAEQAGLTEGKHQVPDAVMRGSKEMARGFLQALFSADGGVQGKTEKGNSVRLSSVSTELLEDVQQLLLNFGIASKLYEERHEAGKQEMPDGNGGTATYERQADHDLVVAKDNLVRFQEEIGFLLESKSEALAERLDSYDRGPYSERFEATVESVEYDGHETVYDLTEPDTNSFVANGLVVHNCGEQPLEEYEACNLGHINLSTLADADAPDWRVWSEEHADEYDSHEAAVSAFLDEAMDWEGFDHRIAYGTRFLENVVTMSDFPVPEIEEKVREMRKIGLGVMGLAQLYIQLGVRYGTEDANEVARQLMTHINHESKSASHELAQERGPFADWEDSKFADPTAYPDWFEHHTGEDAAEWADGYPIRNHNTTTIAPTGTTSMIGNTTGGCEPIYNVAYYKNVSGDVQGDEMLVEFDDYFLRTLEANDIDVEAVKKEAQEQMANNEFDGVTGLETVPDAIGELFVVTGDLSAKQHAAIQCACQEGVDSAISKTVNAPNDASLADAKEAFEFVYDNGGKGVTYYRDGTRSKQVLTTRAENTEFADEDEAAAALVEQITEVFGGIEGFLENEDVQAALDTQVQSLLATADGDETPPGRKRPRPDVLHGVTQRIDTGYGKLYVNINEDPATGAPFELFANIGNSGGFTASFTEALAKTISTSLRSGVDPGEIASELQGIRSPKVAWDKGEQIQSIPDAIGTAMRRYLDGEIDKGIPQQQTIDELEDEATTDGGATRAGAPDDGGATQAETATESPPEPTQMDVSTDAETNGAAADDATSQLIESGESPECPDCGSMSLYYSEGCKTCESCGWSEC